jgi:hypothetical protein
MWWVKRKEGDKLRKDEGIGRNKLKRIRMMGRWMKTKAYLGTWVNLTPSDVYWEG